MQFDKIKCLSQAIFYQNYAEFTGDDSAQSSFGCRYYFMIDTDAVCCDVPRRSLGAVNKRRDLG